LPKRSGEFLFEIVMRRYETRSTVMTTNRPVEDWGKLLGDVPTATAILDRFLHHAEIINFAGDSYRLSDRNRSENAANGTKAPTGVEPAKKNSKRAKAPTGSHVDENARECQKN
ncbi:MAG: ATP-binding protein, partial [Planctomycetales bacterium]|nr:ATP-binding protein [Planctomycetales bacterium]